MLNIAAIIIVLFMMLSGLVYFYHRVKSNENFTANVLTLLFGWDMDTVILLALLDK